MGKTVKNYSQFLKEQDDYMVQPDGPDYREGKNVTGSYEVVAMDSENALVKDKDDALYLFHHQALDSGVLADYTDREIVGTEEDEDGKQDILGEPEVDEYAIASYINDKKDLAVGDGIEDWESGDFDLVGLDDAMLRSYDTPGDVLDYLSNPQD